MQRAAPCGRIRAPGTHTWAGAGGASLASDLPKPNRAAGCCCERRLERRRHGGGGGGSSRAPLPCCSCVGTAAVRLLTAKPLAASADMVGGAAVRNGGRFVRACGLRKRIVELSAEH